MNILLLLVWFILCFTLGFTMGNIYQQRIDEYKQMIIECEKPRQIDKCFLVAEAE